MAEAALWYVGGPNLDDRQELRYSLRSVATNAAFIREPWVVGDVPDWYVGPSIPLQPQREKFANARASITAFVNHPECPDEFVLFMDDVFVVKPTTQVDIIHLGPAREHSTYLNGKGSYAEAVRRTTDWLADHGNPEPLAYLGHTPVALDTQMVRTFLGAYPADLLLEPFMLYVVAGTQGTGRKAGNAKVKRDDNLKHKMDQGIPYLSSNPDTWPGGLGQHIRGMFSEACRWERDWELRPRSD